MLNGTPRDRRFRDPTPDSRHGPRQPFRTRLVSRIRMPMRNRRKKLVWISKDKAQRLERSRKRKNRQPAFIFSTPTKDSRSKCIIVEKSEDEYSSSDEEATEQQLEHYVNYAFVRPRDLNPTAFGTITLTP